ncbi:MAG: DMT family transporter [Gammaproteobacteria bacterium]|jgi:drug/metabolite transporter (DMT)-like permease
MDSVNNSLIKTVLFTGLALIAFAANSVLCRLALGEEMIDASSFTAIRLLAGIIVLQVIISLDSNKKELPAKGSWLASFMLFLYAITFSFAYISLDTGTGALILFGSVQISMLLLSLVSGTRLHFTEWIGLITAFAGFVYLVLPGVTAPSATGFLLMTIAGIAWGVYSLKGRDSKKPLMDTAYIFLRTMPFVVVLVAVTYRNAVYSPEGLLLAIISGAITSGLGYTIWYIALGGLSATQASVLQLLVPVIAAFGGVLFVSEAITLRLTISAVMILGGILLVVSGKYFFQRMRS